MRQTIIILAVLFLAVVAIYFLFYGGSYTNNTAPVTPEPAKDNVVTIKNFAFAPQILSVSAGATVTWTNQDSAPHQINSASFNSRFLSQGESFSFTFEKAGSYDYSCAIHPAMLGTIIVK